MLDFIRTDQLDMLGFTAEYRLIGLLTVGLLLFSLFFMQFVRFLIKRKCSVLLGFIFTSCILSTGLLLYEKRMGMADIYHVWLKSMTAYSFLYAVILSGKAVRSKKV